jgi:hypothetical protein
MGDDGFPGIVWYIPDKLSFYVLSVFSPTHIALPFIPLTVLFPLRYRQFFVAVVSGYI